MNYKLYVGIDISKLAIDVVFFTADNHQASYHKTFSNDYSGFDAMLSWIQTSNNIRFEEILFCCEHTGLYVAPICKWMVSKPGNLWVENALQIKRSIGLKRGKSDKADAAAIANYAFSKQHEARLYKQPSKTVEKIKSLLTFRDLLIRQLVSYKGYISEQKEFNDENAAFCISQAEEMKIVCEEKLKATNQELEDVILEDQELKKQFDLICSVHGIGKQSALYILIQTQGFTTFTDHRKFACYCGVAPFPYASGTSIRGRDRISNLANKKIKSLLMMCCLNVIKSDNEFRRYYLRKKAEGKSFLSIMNAIKNKLLSRVFAVIRKGTPYQMELTNKNNCSFS